MDQKNYKVFYWAPDYSFCGFATSDEVSQTAKKWMKDKSLKIGDRGGGGITHKDDKRKEELVNNVSHIPEIMKMIHHT